MPEPFDVTRPSSGRSGSAALGRAATPSRLALAVTALRRWRTRQVLTMLVAAVAVTALIGWATVLIPNEFFSRDIPPVWWNYPVWILTGVLSGALIATYVNEPEEPSGNRSGVAAKAEAGQGPASPAEPARGTRTERRSGPMGTIGIVLGWFAVGCPVCNKIALLALGYTGALTWFAPLQPVLAVAALVLTSIALVWRLSGQVACPMPTRIRAGQEAI